MRLQRYNTFFYHATVRTFFSHFSCFAARGLSPVFFVSCSMHVFSCSLHSREMKRKKRKKLKELRRRPALFISFLSLCFSATKWQGDFLFMFCHAVARRFFSLCSATKWQGDFLFVSLPRSGKESFLFMFCHEVARRVFSLCSATQWQGEFSLHVLPRSGKEIYRLDALELLESTSPASRARKSRQGISPSGTVIAPGSPILPPIGARRGPLTEAVVVA